MPEHLDLELIALANTLGHSVLIETMKMAAYYLTHSDRTHYVSRTWTKNMNEAKSCYLYVQGTGLNFLVEFYQLNYDADTLKDSFNYYVRRSI